MTTLGAAMRRRRAARAPQELRAKAVTDLQVCADAASTAASQVQIRPLDDDDIAAVLALNYDRLPGKVCTEALALRLQSSVAQCYIAAGAQSTVGSGAGSNVDSTNDTTSQPAVQGFVLIETSRGSADVVLLAVRSDCKRQGGRPSASLSCSYKCCRSRLQQFLSLRSFGQRASSATVSVARFRRHPRAADDKYKRVRRRRRSIRRTVCGRRQRANHHAVVPAITAVA